MSDDRTSSDEHGSLRRQPQSRGLGNESQRAASCSTPELRHARTMMAAR